MEVLPGGVTPAPVVGPSDSALVLLLLEDGARARRIFLMGPGSEEGDPDAFAACRIFSAVLLSRRLRRRSRKRRWVSCCCSL